MDFEALGEALGLEKEEYMELVELLVETGMSDLEKLRVAIEEGNADAAAGAAHSLKGASGNLRLMEIYDIAAKCEEEARKDSLEGLAESVQIMKVKLESIAGLL